MIAIEWWETVLVILLAVVMVFFIFKWMKVKMFYFEKMDFTLVDPNQHDRNRRVFLIHAKDDTTISFSEFERNQATLNLPDDQVLVN
jgi:hypothetical protein